MKIEEIQELTNVINGLSAEQKEVAKSVFMKQLAHIDNLGEVNPETLDKINGGGNIIGDIYRRILGLWFD